MRAAEALVKRGGEHYLRAACLAAVVEARPRMVLNSRRVLAEPRGWWWRATWFAPPRRGSQSGCDRVPRLSPRAVSFRLAPTQVGLLLGFQQEQHMWRLRRMSTSPQAGDDSFLPEAERVRFGENESKRNTMTKAVAKRKYLLRDEDLTNQSVLRPYREEHVGPNAMTENIQGPVVFLIQDIERACLRRWGSEKEFRREQLRREIRRRRQAMRTHTRMGPLNEFFQGFTDDDARVSGGPRASLRDLPWDPVFGSVPKLETESSRVGQRAVHTAIATNAVVLASKLVAFIYTGSASVLSEVVHSIADLGNQCLLAFGIVQSQREADALHPYGYATDQYVWSLISGVGIFFLGCGVSIYHGISGLLMPHEIENVTVGLCVLGTAFVVEGYSFWVALDECNLEAKKAGLTLREYLVQGSDVMNVAVLMEDGVAVVGCAIAAGCLLASDITGNAAYDSGGSILIGSLLGFVAMTLIRKNRDLLVGSALPENRISRVVKMLETDPVVFSVHDVKAIIIGADRGRFKAEINFDAEILAKRCLERTKFNTKALEGTLSEEEVLRYILQYSRSMVATLGDEVDRLEGLIRRELPEIRHVDLEIL